MSGKNTKITVQKLQLFRFLLERGGHGLMLSMPFGEYYECQFAVFMIVKAW